MRRNRALALGLASASGVASLSFAFVGFASATMVNRNADLIYTLSGNNAKSYPTGNTTSPSNGINDSRSPKYNNAATWGASCREDDSANGQTSYAFKGAGQLVIKYSTYFFVWNNASVGTYGTGPNVWGGTNYMGISHVIVCPVADPSTPVADPSTPVADPSTPVADPSTPVADPSTPVTHKASARPSVTFPSTGGSPSNSGSASDNAMQIPSTGGIPQLPHTGASGTSLLLSLGLGLLSLGLLAFGTARRVRQH
jgi:LPXTG-motif cell wall-anchored protein